MLFFNRSSSAPPTRSDPLNIRIADWISGRRGPEHGDVLLDRKRVYILPTPAGIAFGLAMVVLLIGSINYALQLGFFLTFLIISIALVGMYHTHRNLARVLVRGHRVDNLFAGDVASFEFLLTNPTPETRYALQFGFVLGMQRKEDRQLPGRKLPGTGCDVIARSTQIARLGLPTRRRGRLPCPRVRIETRFPFGLWLAWSYITPALEAIVYPTPEQDAPALPLPQGAGDSGAGVASSGDDFAGVRPYQAGDPQKMIAWRLAARSDELSVKLFEATGGGDLILDYRQLPPQMDVEARLRRLSRWVLMADSAQLRYGLELNGNHVELGSGAEHRERCLTALALFRG